MPTATDRLAGLGIVLPAVRPPAGLYSPVVIDGDLAFSSGLVAIENNQIAYRGRLGDTLSVEEGSLSARGACLSSLGNLNAAFGLNRVSRVVKLTGYVAAIADFAAFSTVLDGASRLLIDVFGNDIGRSARTTVGVAALPGGASVELDLVVRITS